MEFAAFFNKYMTVSKFDGFNAENFLVSFKEHLDNMGLVAGYHYTENISQAKITFYNGSEVLFRHLEEPDKLKSLNLGFVELEEMSDTPESTFLMLLSRLRQAKREGWDETAQLEGHKGFQYRLFGHTNPEPNKGWIYKNFVENIGGIWIWIF